MKRILERKSGHLEAAGGVRLYVCPGGRVKGVVQRSSTSRASFSPLGPFLFVSVICDT